MHTTVFPVAIFCAMALIAVLALRGLSTRVRILFDLVCFVAISGYLARIGVSPFLDPGSAESGQIISVRIIACAWWLLGARTLNALLWFALHRNRQSRAERLSSDVTGALIYLAATLVIVKSVLALPLSGVFATSGVLAIVLGLAMQNTLGDVFAGIAVGVEAPFKIGDRIALADKLEGHVVQVNWRSVWIQTDDNDFAIIPNSLIAKNEIINRSYPSQTRSVSVDLPCPAIAHPERVIETLVSATWLCPTILRTPTPTAVLKSLGRKSHLYSVSFSVDGVRGLTATKGLLLLQCRRQLYFAGLLTMGVVDSHESEIISSNRSPDRRSLLQDLGLFDALDEKSLGHLVEQLKTIDLDEGQVLFAEGSVDATLYLVTGGILQLTRSLEAAGSDTIGSIGAGDYVGEIGLLTGAPHATTATALTACRVQSLSRTALAPLIAANAELALAFDKSARKGLSILHREAAARAAGLQTSTEPLLVRIRNYFHLGP